MHLERLILANFRCFGPDPQTIPFDAGLTAFVGANGAGKTAVMQALLRLFGVTGEQRRVTRQDFHVPADETTAPKQRQLVIEAILAFPELDSDEPEGGVAVPQFFHQMAADEQGRLKCRLRLDATWTDDGSVDGAIEALLRAVRTFDAEFNESDCTALSGLDRTRVQMIYVPAVRDGASQVTSFLRGRLWRAVNWSQAVRDALAAAGETVGAAFAAEDAVDLIVEKLEQRWQEVNAGGTSANPTFRPIDLRFPQFIRKIEVVFRPDELRRDRALEELSDGQRSLFHMAMTASILDVEATIASTPNCGFQAEAVTLPSLTLIALEEPENNLAPFYLSRIVRQLRQLTSAGRAQAVVSSHSAGILARVDPTEVRHFRLVPSTRTALVRGIRLPPDEEDAGKFIREAVRTYPELYFARFVILGEGSSEEVVLPVLAEAMDLPIDRSFVAVVPLGGRHVNHLWRLLNDLEIPHATLLDLDCGRAGGGWGRIKVACKELLANGKSADEVFGGDLANDGAENALAWFDRQRPNDKAIIEWVNRLRDFGVYFCAPLDLDFSMLRAFETHYQQLETDMKGPSDKGDPKQSVLGEEGNPRLYPPKFDAAFKWYRYLFLGRGKPTTHVRILSRIDRDVLKNDAPNELAAILNHAAAVIAPNPKPT